MEIIIKMSDATYEKCKKLVEIGKANYLETKIANSTPLPENATNGDMIKALFPNVRITEMLEVGVVQVHDGLLGESRNFSCDWWNAPYERGES